MKAHRKNAGLIFLIGSLMISSQLSSQDQNFYIYLCFGQWNMEGQGNIENLDMTVTERFKTFQALDCSNLGRAKETWYTASPPTCQCYSKLSPADYFGRTMAANLPDSISIGIINVSVGGCDIRLFDKDIYQDYDSTYMESWFLDKVEDYEWNPYQYLINLALKAQQDGVIKGILLHQGETNTGQDQWPSYVKKIYNDMLTDLSLYADSVPLLAGEVLSAAGNCCASMNTIINRLPDTIPTSYVISSEGCDGMDNAHFNSEGYRELGRRYAVQMLSLLGYETVYGRGAESDFLEAECAIVGSNWMITEDASASNEGFVTILPGVESIEEPPADSANGVYIPFSTENAGYFNLYARLYCVGATNDSYWVRIDNDPFEMYDGLRTTGWQWLAIESMELSAGEHTLTIGCREDGAKLDKINISDFLYGPSGISTEAENLCEPPYTPSGIQTMDINAGYKLAQNQPNPASGATRIAFEIPVTAYVSLKVYDMLGTEITELAGSIFLAGEHVTEFNRGTLSAGSYYYMLRADEFVATRRMTILTGN
jgi:hypothetical protein